MNNLVLTLFVYRFNILIGVKEMKDQVLSIWKCRRCSKEVTYVERDTKSFGAGCDDDFILTFVIPSHLEKGIKNATCYNCNNNAVLDFIGMEGLSDD